MQRISELPVKFWGETAGFPNNVSNRTGQEAAAFLTLSLEDFLSNVHPEDVSFVKAALCDLLENNIKAMETTYRRCPKTDGCQWVKSLGRLVSGHGKEYDVLFISETNVTEYKKIEKELRDTVEIVQRERSDAESLRQIAAAISCSLNMNETVSRILEEIKKVIPYDRGTVQLLNNGQLEIIGGAGFKNLDKVMELRFPYPEEGSLSTLAIDSRQPVISNDIAIDFPRFRQPDIEHPVCSWIGIPLIRYGEVIGLMALDSLHKDAYQAHHVELAGVTAVHVAIAIENARLHEQAYQMAMEDALTGAGSRYRFQIEGRIMFETARRAEYSIAVIMFDIDHFKKVNDNYGHQAGDDVLKLLSAVVIEELRAVDLFARYGGEEFVIILPGADEKAALAVYNRINTRFASIDYPGIEDEITVSAGIFSAVPERVDTLEKFVERADKTLYYSKEHGRNRTTLYSSIH